MERAISKAGRSYQAFDYPGTGHWFAETDRSTDYHQLSASLAFDRTCAHLKSMHFPAGKD
jgi:carboxymethylenebutenolidase